MPFYSGRFGLLIVYAFVPIHSFSEARTIVEWLATLRHTETLDFKLQNNMSI